MCGRHARPKAVVRLATFTHALPLPYLPHRRPRRAWYSCLVCKRCWRRLATGSHCRVRPTHLAAAHPLTTRCTSRCALVCVHVVVLGARGEAAAVVVVRTDHLAHPLRVFGWLGLSQHSCCSYSPGHFFPIISPSHHHHHHHQTRAQFRLEAGLPGSGQRPETFDVQVPALESNASSAAAAAGAHLMAGRAVFDAPSFGHNHNASPGGGYGAPPQPLQPVYYPGGGGPTSPAAYAQPAMPTPTYAPGYYPPQQA